EYRNTMAVLYHQLGRKEQAARAAKLAHELDPRLPEAAYDLAVLVAERALAAAGPADAGDRIARSSDAIARSRSLVLEALREDPGFAEAWELDVALDAAQGHCTEAVARLAA